MKSKLGVFLMITTDKDKRDDDKTEHRSLTIARKIQESVSGKIIIRLYSGITQWAQ